MQPSRIKKDKSFNLIMNLLRAKRKGKREKFKEKTIWEDAAIG